MSHDAVFRIGEVVSVEGRSVKVKVDKLKNAPYLLYKGDIIKNVSVGAYLKIRKGFSRLITKVEGEYITEQKVHENSRELDFVRYLSLSVIGYVEGDRFTKGAKELPLVGDETFLLSKAEYDSIHDFCSPFDLKISPGVLLEDGQHDIGLGVSKLFASHFGIFGNTGSGKSYTLAKIYNCLFKDVVQNASNQNNSKFVLFDFNGEYSANDVIIAEKKVYRLSTRREKGLDRLPIDVQDVTNVEFLSILANATEKTQKPFLKRALRLYRRVLDDANSENRIKKILRTLVKRLLSVAEKQKGELIQNYIEQVITNSTGKDFKSCLFWKMTTCAVMISGKECYPNQISESNIDFYAKIEESNILKQTDVLLDIVNFLFIQLVIDLLENRVVNEHIAPVISKLRANHDAFSKIFELRHHITTEKDYDLLWGQHFLCVIDLNDVNTEMKKLVPLLISIQLYREHKQLKRKYLNIIIDEAHNILSYSSQRESETWKDYRLETFEEIIKEGRKFGVFLTIASQRPSDISPTIISQLHNFFIHRLVNEHDLRMVSQSISYLDKVAYEMLPIMPTGACVLAGLVTQMPIVMQIKSLESSAVPTSETIDLNELWK